MVLAHLSSWLLCFLDPNSVEGSYAIYVGRNLTADGSVFLAGYGDEPSSHWLEIDPRIIGKKELELWKCLYLVPVIGEVGEAKDRGLATNKKIGEDRLFLFAGFQRPNA